MTITVDVIIYVFICKCIFQLIIWKLNKLIWSSIPLDLFLISFVSLSKELISSKSLFLY
jgi:hypothetical protein